MSSTNDRRPAWLADWISGSLLLTAGLALLWVYAEGQLNHTVRFLFELIVYCDRILGF